MKSAKILVTLGLLGVVAVGLGIFFFVSKGKAPSPSQLSSWGKTCEGTSDTGKVACWEDLTREVVKKEGIAPAFDLISYLYEKNPEFAEPCHAMVHIIGQVAYSQFRATGTVDLSEKNAFCAFGFYHGFMEMLVARKGTIAEAREFCQYVDTKLGDITPGAKLGCYHGIGHGSTDIHNPQYFGNERAVIAPALANCEAFATDSEMLKLCVTGIFDSVALAYYNNGENGFVMKKDDPLWLCREQPERYKESCYLDMMPAMIWLGEYDLTRAGPMVLAHAERSYRKIALRALAENSVRFVIHKKPVEDYLSYCRSLEAGESLACVSGLGVGIMQFGPPGVEYKDAIAFCVSDRLNTDEQDSCMKDVLQYVSQRYDRKKSASICRAVDAQFEGYCRE